MADKEIIDGIDVSGCEYCVKMTKYRCIIQRDVYKYLCKENPNCYFKQLKRKEQALTEIKEIAEEQIPYLNIDKAKTITEVEYDYADKIYNLEQRMYKILQKISECEMENDR